MATILRVNMADLSVRREEVADRYRELGGRGMTSALVADEVPPHCHPLSAENKLVIAPGSPDRHRGTVFRPSVGRGQEPADRDDQGVQLRRHGGDRPGDLRDSSHRDRGKTGGRKMVSA